MRAATVCLSALIVFSLLAGCSILGPLPDRTRFFVLTPIPSASPDSNETLPIQGTVYGLGPITLPAYLERLEVATRTAAAEITFSENDYWAEPLATNVSTVLLRNLDSLLGSDRIAAYPWTLDVPVAYQIQINFLRFECDATGEAQLTATWTVTDPRDGRLQLARSTALTRPAKADDTTACVAGLSSALGAFSEEIAGALRTLPAPRAKS